MEAEARDGGVAPEAIGEPATMDVVVAADSPQDVDPLAADPSAEVDTLPIEPDSSPPLQAAHAEQQGPVDQEPAETALPHATNAPAVSEEPISETGPSASAPDEPAPADPTPADDPAAAVVSTENAPPLEPAPAPTVAHDPVAMPAQSAAEPADAATAAPTPESDIAQAGTSHGATTSAASNGQTVPTLTRLSGAPAQPASAGDPSYRDIQVVPSEHSGMAP
jgi:hypothetical protein